PPAPSSDNPVDPRPPVTIDADGGPLPPGAQLVNGKIVPIPPVAKSGAETRAQMDRVNGRRDIDHAAMSAQSRVAHEPRPSTGPRIVQDSGFFWGGAKGRAW